MSSPTPPRYALWAAALPALALFLLLGPAPCPAQEDDPFLDRLMQEDFSYLQQLFEEQPELEEDPFQPSPKGEELMRARIMAQNDRYPEALARFGQLMAEYPGDEEIYEYYVDTLISHRDFALARGVLDQWMRERPDSLRAVALEASMFYAAGEFEAAFPNYERILARKPGDTGARADYAYALLAAGWWDLALDLFSQVLDEDPLNDEAAKEVQEILAAYSPQAVSGLAVTTAGDESVSVDQSATLTVWLSRRFRTEFFTGLSSYSRPGKGVEDDVATFLAEERVRIAYVATPSVELRAGIGFHQGFRFGVSPEAGIGWKTHDTGELNLVLALDRPWLDNIEATTEGGSIDTVQAGYAWTPWPWLYLEAGFEGNLFAIHDKDPYGYQAVYRAAAFATLWDRPIVRAGYLWERRAFHYDDDSHTPVDVTREADVHTLLTEVVVTPCRWLDLDMTVGVGRDFFRDGMFFVLGPGFTLRLGRRVEIRGGADYRSDAGVDKGGEAVTFASEVRILF